MNKNLFSILGLATLSLGAFLAAPALARDNFVTSPTAPYPPGCVSSDNFGVSTPTFARQVYNDSIITLADAAGGADNNVNLLVYRRGCTEENRSLLYVEIETFAAQRRIGVPRVFIDAGGTRYPMRLTPEANTFEINHSGLVVGPGTYEFLVDGPAESAVNANTPIIDPEAYSAPLTLIIQDSLNTNNEYNLPLPAWNDDIRPQAYPLNGRLTGPWVSAGAENQGFVISFNEFLDEEGTRQQVFFSWYTYDLDGNPLWLASSNFYTYNAFEVELPLAVLTGGTFLGPEEPTSTPAGTATLTSLSCGELSLAYDLTAIGLGTGTVTLRRTFALEVAGYACRDVKGRMDER